MKTSRIVTLATAIAITALVIGAAALFPNTPDSAKPETTAPVVTTTLEPVIVVAAR